MSLYMPRKEQMDLELEKKEGADVSMRNAEHVAKHGMIREVLTGAVSGTTGAIRRKKDSTDPTIPKM